MLLPILDGLETVYFPGREWYELIQKQYRSMDRQYNESKSDCEILIFSLRKYLAATDRD